MAKVILLSTLGALLVAIGAANAQPTTKPHTCYAPCVVQFGSRMAEDQFCIDYRGNGTLRVWRDRDTVCR